MKYLQHSSTKEQFKEVEALRNNSPHFDCPQVIHIIWGRGKIEGDHCVICMSLLEEQQRQYKQEFHIIILMLEL
ncbi:hypothetical protein FGO68_gene5607 [Halteria grandinella]|uniref:Uncharacterized protein n=1 Tax=Halteria grandinella TaxID=5974 RepID=A0A8J8NRR1_HALGN|nr:hypothetical protein FGO68_gene5607 [Halteria grandinella]